MAVKKKRKRYVEEVGRDLQIKLPPGVGLKPGDRLKVTTRGNKIIIEKEELPTYELGRQIAVEEIEETIGEEILRQAEMSDEGGS
ncbi:MAG: hypothetical protein ACK4SY_08940 [Pyrobaculum sp.]